jgi:hypothetical protein
MHLCMYTATVCICAFTLFGMTFTSGPVTVETRALHGPLLVTLGTTLRPVRRADRLQEHWDDVSAYKGY